jgi:hypothetical protein
MLVFIDESGDTGFKIKQGSSRYFVISLVIFEDNDEAIACDQRIQLLKKELKYPNDFEFHFKENSHKVRKALLETLAPYNFFYYGIVINKDPQKLWGEGFKNRESFYKYTCGLVFENARACFKDANIKIDSSGRKVFRSQLAKYLKSKINLDGRNCIKKVKMERSQSNNLLQLADYIAGVINRYVQNKKYSKDYRKLIAPKEIYVQIWPK